MLDRIDGIYLLLEGTSTEVLSLMMNREISWDTTSNSLLYKDNNGVVHYSTPVSDHTLLSNIGRYTHINIDTHIDNNAIHIPILKHNHLVIGSESGGLSQSSGVYYDPVLQKIDFDQNAIVASAIIIGNVNSPHTKILDTCTSILIGESEVSGLFMRGLFAVAPDNYKVRNTLIVNHFGDWQSDFGFNIFGSNSYNIDGNPHRHNMSTLDGITIQSLNGIPSSLIGVANGICPLDATSVIASKYLPSYIDDVIECANLAARPATGETGKIYIVLDTNDQYRWSGSAYVKLSTGSYALSVLTDVTLASLATNNLLRYNGTKWVNWIPTYISANQTITLTSSGDITNTACTGTTALNHVVTVNGIKGITIPTLSAGVLKYTGSAFVFDNNIALLSNIPIASSTNPNMDGTAAVGVGTTWARADHVHPTNTNTQSLNSILTSISALSLTTTGLIKLVNGVASLDTSTYITNNKTITVTGDITGNGTTAITATLNTVNSNVGSFGTTTAIPVVTVNAKGLVTAVSTVALTAAGIGALSSVTSDSTSRTANTVYAAPIASAGAATFRTLVPSDIPNLSSVYVLNTMIGASNGVCGLDINGKIYISALGTGTPSNSTVLYGDGVWRSLSVTGLSGTIADKQIGFGNGTSLTSDDNLTYDVSNRILQLTVPYNTGNYSTQLVLTDTSAIDELRFTKYSNASTGTIFGVSVINTQVISAKNSLIIGVNTNYQLSLGGNGKVLATLGTYTSAAAGIDWFRLSAKFEQTFASPAIIQKASDNIYCQHIFQNSSGTDVGYINSFGSAFTHTAQTKASSVSAGLSIDSIIAGSALLLRAPREIRFAAYSTALADIKVRFDLTSNKYRFGDSALATTAVLEVVGTILSTNLTGTANRLTYADSSGIIQQSNMVFDLSNKTLTINPPAQSGGLIINSNIAGVANTGNILSKINVTGPNSFSAFAAQNIATGTNAISCSIDLLSPTGDELGGLVSSYNDLSSSPTRVVNTKTINTYGVASITLANASVNGDIILSTISNIYNVDRPNPLHVVVDSARRAVGINTIPNDSAALHVQYNGSYVKGFLQPFGTTVNKNDIMTPANGLSFYDTDLLRPTFYNGTAWRTLITKEDDITFDSTVTFTNLATATNGKLVLASSTGQLSVTNVYQSNIFAIIPTTTTASMDCSLYDTATLTLSTNNVTLTLNNLQLGSKYQIRVKQGSTPRTLTFAASGYVFKSPGGSYAITATANAIDILSLTVMISGEVIVVNGKGVS